MDGLSGLTTRSMEPHLNFHHSTLSFRSSRFVNLQCLWMKTAKGLTRNCKPRMGGLSLSGLTMRRHGIAFGSRHSTLSSSLISYSIRL